MFENKPFTTIILLLGLFFSHSISAQNGIDSKHYHVLRGRIDHALVKFETLKKGRIAFLGGSITYNPGWRDSLMQYFNLRFPETEFEFIQAGIPSFGSTENAFRMERDLFQKGAVDLLFVEAAVNDALKGRSDQEILRAMEGIVRHAKFYDPATDIVFMYFVDPQKIEDYHSHKSPHIIKLHDSIARYYNIPAINLAREVTDRLDAGEFSWENDFKNLHPSPFGQGVYARSMISFLNVAFDQKISNVSTEPTAPLPSPMDPYCYDNGKLVEAYKITTTDGWKKIKNWKPDLKARTRNNYVNVPMMVGTYPTAPIVFDFEGNAVGIAVAAGPDAGIVQYRIDHGPWQNQDLFTKHSELYYLPWYYVLADGLQTGKHRLEIKLSKNKNEKSVGEKCMIRYFFYNAPH
jgi:sialidase-1